MADDGPGKLQSRPFGVGGLTRGRHAPLADGGIRYGYDVLKMLALGAQVVLVGRPIVRGAHGGGAEGVTLVLNKMKNELVEAMTLTGAPSVRAVSRSILS